MSVRVALIGCGTWGQNLLRTLAETPRADVVAVADTNAMRRSRSRQITPDALFVSSLEALLEKRPQALVVATPSASHAAIAIAALEAGLDIFVEKPLALSIQDAERCVNKAALFGRVAMVGHLLRYHPAVVRLVAMAREGRLGEIRHFSSSRLRSGGDHSSSIVWSLGPHDLSVLRAVDPSPITALETQWFDDGERVLLDIVLESGVTARIELARSNPTKERRISIGGSLKNAVFDDVRAPDRLLICENRGDVSLASSFRSWESVAFAEELPIEWREPLALEIDHFLDCVERRENPRTSFEDGAWVVRVLARVEATNPRRSGTAVSRVE